MVGKSKEWSRSVPSEVGIAMIARGMPGWRHGARSLTMQWLSILLTAGVSMALSIWLARRMEPSGFGRYAYLLNMATLFGLVQDAGMRTLIMRERVAPSASLAAYSADLPSLARGHLLLATLLLAICIVASIPWGVDPALAIAVLYFGVLGATQLVSVQLKAAGMWVREARWQFGARVLSALAIVAAVMLFGAEPGVVFGAWAMGLLIAYGLLARDVRDRPRWRPDAPVYRAAAGFLWIDLGTCLYRRSDILILHSMAGSSEAGHYAAAARLYEGVMMLAAPLALLFFRRLRLVRDDVRARQRLQRGGLWFAALSGLALAIGGVTLGPWVIESLYGQAYASSASSLLGWMFAAFVFVMPNSVLTQSAIALDRERCYMLGVGLAAATSITLNLLLVPRHGAIGAAMALIVTEAVLGATVALGLRLPRTRGQ